MIFFTLEEVTQIHEKLLVLSGGDSGIRDSGLLESALAQPKAKFNGEYLHQSIFEKAAAYLYHIVQNHPFIDGNKRTGAMIATMFLRVHDYHFQVTEDEYVEFILAVAQGQLDKAQITKYLEQHCTFISQ